MPLNRIQKEAAYKTALEITKAYGNCGEQKIFPHVALKALYETIQEIMEDVLKAAAN